MNKKPVALLLLLISAGYYALLIVLLPKPSVALQQAGAAAESHYAPSPLVLVVLLITLLLFANGLYRAILTHVVSGRTIRKDLKRRSFAPDAVQHLPVVCILIPARNEARVIANTMQSLARMDYSSNRFRVVVITDERERTHGHNATLAIAQDQAARLNTRLGADVFSACEIPCGFDGNVRKGRPAALGSTKGRALNYGLLWLADRGDLPSADLVGVLDADGRMHPQVLRHVAALHRNHGARIMQGPVLQVSNLKSADLIGVMAGVELSVHHLSRMRNELHSQSDIPRFLAGTNYFIEPGLLLDSGGWDSLSLVEDAELGLHVFLSQAAKATWLPCHEIEQTSPSWRIYIKQRERWALGHLQLLPIIRRSSLPVWIKARLVLKVLSHFIASPLDLVLPIVSWFLLAHLSAEQEVPLLTVITLVMMAGSLYTWGYLSRGIFAINEFSSQPLPPGQLRWHAVLLMVCMPALALFQLIPRVMAIYHYVCMAGDAGWYKTERSPEASLELLTE